MGFQTDLLDRAQLTRYIQFLQRHGKQSAARELSDILELQDEASDSGSQSTELLQWIEQLEPVLKAVDSWKNRNGKEMLFDVMWREYRSEVYR